jgi:hypothetical protein
VDGLHYTGEEQEGVSRECVFFRSAWLGRGGNDDDNGNKNNNNNNNRRRRKKLRVNAGYVNNMKKLLTT